MHGSRSRREVLRLGGGLLAGGSLLAVLGACAPATPPAPVAPTTAPAAAKAVAAPPPAPAAAAKPRAGGTLNAGFGNGLQNLDPFVSALNNWVAVRNAVYETLVWPDPAANMEIRPLLAESWTWSADRLQLTMKLRSGVKYHDGTDFSARDVRFSVEKVKDPATASYLAGLFSAVDAVDDSDPQTVRFTLSRPSRLFLTGLTQLHIVAAAHADRYKEQPVGTGPFRWLEWSPSEHIKVERNQNYWTAGQPLLDAITWKIIPNVETMNVNLQTGGVEWFNTPELKDVERLRADPNLDVTVSPPLERGLWIYNNMSKAPLDKQEVRQAISCAMDREAVVTTGVNGLGVANCSFLAPAHPLHNPAVKDKFKYDLGRAKDLLARGGYADASKLELRLMVDGAFPFHVIAAQVLQASLGELGANVSVEKVDNAGSLARRQANDWELWIGGLGRVGGDPHLEVARGVVLQPGPQSVVGLRPGMFPSYEELLRRADSTFDADEMKKVYFDLQEAVADMNPTTMILHHAQVEVTRKALRGYQLHPWFLYDFRPLWLDRA